MASCSTSSSCRQAAIDEQTTNAARWSPAARVDFASSGTGLAVKKGAPKPDISTADALKKTLLVGEIDRLFHRAERASTWSSMFDKMGIGNEVKPKLKQTPSGVFVGTLIASGEAEIGFQQISELVHFAGIDYVGPLPADVQRITVFSSGIHTAAKQARRGQGAGQVPDRAGGGADDQEARPGAGLRPAQRSRVIAKPCAAASRIRRGWHVRHRG